MGIISLIPIFNQSFIFLDTKKLCHNNISCKNLLKKNTRIATKDSYFHKKPLFKDQLSYGAKNMPFFLLFSP